MSPDQIAVLEKAIRALPCKAAANSREARSAFRWVLFSLRRAEIEIAKIKQALQAPQEAQNSIDRLEQLSARARDLVEGLRSLDSGSSELVTSLYQGDFVRAVENVADALAEAALAIVDHRSAFLSSGFFTEVKQHGSVPRGFEQRYLTTRCRQVFENYTGERPGYSSDPLTSRRSGPFVDFVTAVFRAFGLGGKPGEYIVEELRRR
jgi:ParB-like chromosome segregation protein Spo0J